ncbi:hypothetical protein JCM8208_006929 [Rhodotorula glutinis]
MTASLAINKGRARTRTTYILPTSSRRYITIVSDRATALFPSIRNSAGNAAQAASIAQDDVLEHLAVANTVVSVVDGPGRFLKGQRGDNGTFVKMQDGIDCSVALGELNSTARAQLQGLRPFVTQRNSALDVLVPRGEADDGLAIGVEMLKAAGGRQGSMEVLLEELKARLTQDDSADVDAPVPPATPAVVLTWPPVEDEIADMDVVRELGTSRTFGGMRHDHSALATPNDERSPSLLERGTAAEGLERAKQHVFVQTADGDVALWYEGDVLERIKRTSSHVEFQVWNTVEAWSRAPDELDFRNKFSNFLARLRAIAEKKHKLDDQSKPLTVLDKKVLSFDVALLTDQHLVAALVAAHCSAAGDHRATTATPFLTSAYIYLLSFYPDPADPHILTNRINFYLARVYLGLLGVNYPDYRAFLLSHLRPTFAVGATPYGGELLDEVRGPNGLSSATGGILLYTSAVARLQRQSVMCTLGKAQPLVDAHRPGMVVAACNELGFDVGGVSVGGGFKAAPMPDLDSSRSALELVGSGKMGATVGMCLRASRWLADDWAVHGVEPPSGPADEAAYKAARGGTREAPKPVWELRQAREAAADELAELEDQASLDEYLSGVELDLEGDLAAAAAQAPTTSKTRSQSEGVGAASTVVRQEAFQRRWIQLIDECNQAFQVLHRAHAAHGAPAGGLELDVSFGRQYHADRGTTSTVALRRNEKIYKLYRFPVPAAVEVKSIIDFLKDAQKKDDEGDQALIHLVQPHGIDTFYHYNEGFDTKLTDKAGPMWKVLCLAAGYGVLSPHEQLAEVFIRDLPLEAAQTSRWAMQPVVIGRALAGLSNVDNATFLGDLPFRTAAAFIRTVARLLKVLVVWELGNGGGGFTMGDDAQRFMGAMRRSGVDIGAARTAVHPVAGLARALGLFA